MKILIIEDHMPYVEDLTEALEEAGHIIVSMSEFSTLEKCVADIGDIAPDLILLDHTIAKSFDGADIHKAVSTRYRIISIATNKQNYCDEHFLHKAIIILDSKELLAMIDSAK